MMDTDNYLLLTGATGLLGRSLVRDLSATGRRVAILVRGSKTATAEARADEILDDWREVAGVTVESPVVLAGDITSAKGMEPCCANMSHQAIRLPGVATAPRPRLC